VIDDVWQARHVEPFRVDAPRCRVLFTTRDARITAALGAYDHSLDVLTTEQSLELLARRSNQPLGSLLAEAALQVLWGTGRYDAEDAADQFVDLSLATRTEDRSIKLHDLQLDYTRRQAGEASLPALHQRFLEGYAAGSKNGWPGGPNDGYFFSAPGSPPGPRGARTRSAKSAARF
jgi:hypothetical protein